MAATTDPVVLNSRRNLGTWVSYLALAVACAAAFFGLTAKNDAGDVADTVKAAGPPCVDLDEGEGVRLSDGCAAMVDNLNIFCARNRRYCVRSQRRAVQLAQTIAAEREIGAHVQVPEGGGGTEGRTPQSPQAPSPENPGGGGTNPQPDPERPSEGPTAPPNEPSTPAPEQPGSGNPPPVTSSPPVVDLPGLIPEPLKPTLCGVAGVCLDP